MQEGNTFFFFEEKKYQTKMNWWQRPTRTFAAIDDCQEFRVWFWASSHLVVSCRRSNFKEHSQDLLNESDQPCLQIDISKGLYFALDIKVSFSQETTKSNSVIVPFCWKSISSSFSSFWRNSFIHLTGFPRVHSCISPLSPAQVKGKNPAIATTFRTLTLTIRLNRMVGLWPNLPC